MSSVEFETLRPPIEEPDDRLFEVVDGLRRAKRMGALEVNIMSLLGIHLGYFVLTQGLGRVEVEMLFHLGREGQPHRRPDVAFVSFDRWPKDQRITSEQAWKVIPDLAVEVVSPTNTAIEVEEKVVEYLKVGVRAVWVVHPSTSRIYIHDDSPTVQVIGRDGHLDGGDLLPGFRLELSRIFELD